ncbi:hypothetical protein D6D01_07951 [Aureobasidium pullulans]|uniref:F-box domain-containing protein n=1 Tax=Aureobasidium pullulans TaxID=5580 RepID=A0A4S9KI29_AURPU|nr:hypothetical protein D6D01_07951 [Aureobasidium pullulans]
MGPELLARSQFAQLTLVYFSTDGQPVKLSKPTASPVTKKTKPLYNTGRLPYNISTISPLTARKRRARNSFQGQLQECRERDTIYDKNRHFIEHASPNARNRKRLHYLLYQDDCVRNPYLHWSRQELMIALTQCKIPLPEQGEGSRFKCRAVLEKAIRASQSARSLLLDLPKEIRMMVYELALWQDTDEPIDVVKDPRTWPALSGVSRQVRQESTEVILRTNCFRLRTIKIPATVCHLPHWTPALISGTYSWTPELFNFCKKLGTEGVTKLRRLSFAFGCSEVQINLACLDASQWIVRALYPYERIPLSVLGESLKFWQSKKQKYVGTSMLDVTHTRRRDLCLYAIEETQKEIKAAQLAMNGFAELCGTSKRVKATIEGLGILATAVLDIFFPKDILGGY